MGASSSSPAHISGEQKEAECLANSTGCLSILRDTFFKLSDPDKHAIPSQRLQECFSVSITGLVSEGISIPTCFPRFLDSMGPAVVENFFLVNNGMISWVAFLKGYMTCCGRVSSTLSLKTLYKLFNAMSVRAGLISKLDFEFDDSTTGIHGSLLPCDVLMFLWMCWVMSRTSTALKSTERSGPYILPNINPMLLSILCVCSKANIDLLAVDADASGIEVAIPAQKLHEWALTTVPALSHCLAEYVQDRLYNHSTWRVMVECSTSLPTSTGEHTENMHLLTSGRAWAISLSLDIGISEMFVRACSPVGGTENLLYRSSVHGKGLSRFWSSIEGYNASLLILILSSSLNIHDGENQSAEWVIGVLTEHGFANKSNYYGNSGYLIAVSPIFRVLPPIGREKNFVYSHLRPSGKMYELDPKPVGLAFGGTIGNERIFIEEDFCQITVRHHVVDKTYKAGPLFPNQGLLPVESPVLEVEVWGLGGASAKEEHYMYQRRESLFSEQRRKVDLRTFGRWEDSPEKIMTDMLGDPNRVRREDR